MNKIVLINNIGLQVKEFNGQRVVTFKDIDAVHKRAEGTAKRNFNTNKKHLLENVDYYFVKPADVQGKTTVVHINSPGTYLITVSGYLKIVNHFNKGNEATKFVLNKYFNDGITVIAENVFEYEFGMLLNTVLKDVYTIIPQYKVDNYRIDYYIPELNLAIEYDEYHHKKQYSEDIKREKDIKKVINCDFIRVNHGKELEGLNKIFKLVKKGAISNEQQYCQD